MSDAFQIVLLVVGLFVVQATLMLFALRWVRRRTAALATSVRDELTSEGIRRGPEAAVYRGGSGGRSKLKGNGVIVLTERRLVFRKIFGKDVVVPLAEVVGVRSDAWFLGAWTGGRLHLILRLAGGEEVGFMVEDHAGWSAALGGAA